MVLLGFVWRDADAGVSRAPSRLPLSPLRESLEDEIKLRPLAGAFRREMKSISEEEQPMLK